MKLTCQEGLIPGATLVDKWATIQALGFDGIELQGRGDFAFQKRLPELRAAREAGAVMPSVCVNMLHFIGDFDADKRRDAIANMKSLLSTIAAVGGYGAVTLASFGMFSTRLPPFTPPRSPEEDRAVLLEGLHELGEHAAREGVLVLLEPLNRYEDHMLNTVAQAAELTQAVGSHAVRVMGDLFHMSIEEDDLDASIRADRAALAHIHLADSNRLQPGTGHTDFAAALAALREIGFTGSLALECRLRGEPRKALAATASYLRGLM